MGDEFSDAYEALQDIRRARRRPEPRGWSDAYSAAHVDGRCPGIPGWSDAVRSPRPSAPSPTAGGPTGKPPCGPSAALCGARRHGDSSRQGYQWAQTAGAGPGTPRVPTGSEPVLAVLKDTADNNAGGDPDDAAYREVLVRWFQFGALCPIFRLHGFRLPWLPLGGEMAGGPNEVWSYGEEAYEIMRGYLELRERLRPYIAEQMASAAREGLPPMRPLFLEFPEDEQAWTVADQFLLGSDLLIAPVTESGAISRETYLPAGAHWRCAWTGTTYGGGTWRTLDAPLDRIPLLLRDDAQLPVAG